MYSPQVLITDGNDVVLRLLDKNKAFLSRNKAYLNQTTTATTTNSTSTTNNSTIIDGLIVKELIWGNLTSIENALSELQGSPQIIMGADVILWPNYTKPLLVTIKYLLSLSQSHSHSLPPTEESVCYISYVERATSVTELFFKLCAELCLEVKEIDASLFLPQDCSDNLKLVHKHLYQLKLATNNTACSFNTPFDISEFTWEQEETQDSPF